MRKILTKILGTQHERALKTLQPHVKKINSLEAATKSLSNSQLQGKTAEFKEKLDQGATLDDICHEAFAVCREASWRQLGMRHYDVQLIGGLVLHKGTIAEMRTGEGKTLVATLPIYLNGLSGRGTHIVTVNDYLASRDCEWMGHIYRWLGLSTGTIVHDTSNQERKDAYAADITYGTNNEFGFDYLRDNMKFHIDDYVQRELHYAIVDECDSILIDESRTPLIISGPSEDSIDKYYEINKIIPHLKNEIHFTMEEKTKTASLTEEGNAKVEELLNIGNIFEPENLPLLHHIYQGLKAHHLFKRDVDYMIKDGEIIIVDEFTGRLMEGRRWSDGLHQAVEAKEGVNIRSENQTLATITFQNYFRMYSKLAGMTGTAETESIEFKKIYNLNVMVIPTNKPIQRLDHNDVIYKTEHAKFKAIAEDIKDCSKKGQPVLVGTVSIEKSEKISRALQKASITHNVLNAKHHEHEAEIVAQAGRKNAVTIATNMAGRGTDIVLGGNSEFLAKRDAKKDWDEQHIEEQIQKYTKQCEDEKQEVIEAGGLYIIGTERHESRRIDNQLRGRSGRQGDPGASRFYLSLEDDLMRIFNGERLQKIMSTLKVPDDEPIMAGMVTRAIEGAQKKVEGHNFDIRKHLLEYDDVMNQQRTFIYNLRRNILQGNDIERTTLDMLGEVTSTILDTFAHDEAKPENWNLVGLKTALIQQFGLQWDVPVPQMSSQMTNEMITQITPQTTNQADHLVATQATHQAMNQTTHRMANQMTPQAANQMTHQTNDQLTASVGSSVKDAYDHQKKELGDFFPQIQRMILLETIDNKWKEHLAQMDQLKEGINLRAYAQKDPLIEYKKEAFRAFEMVNHLIRTESIEKIMKVQIVSEDQVKEPMHQEEFSDNYQYQGGEEPGTSPFFDTGWPLEAAAQQNHTTTPSTPPPPSATKKDPPPNRAERRRLERLSKKKRHRQTLNS